MVGGYEQENALPSGQELRSHAVEDHKRGGGKRNAQRPPPVRPFGKHREKQQEEQIIVQHLKSALAALVVRPERRTGVIGERRREQVDEHEDRDGDHKGLLPQAHYAALHFAARRLESPPQQKKRERQLDKKAEEKVFAADEREKRRRHDDDDREERRVKRSF